MQTILSHISQEIGEGIASYRSIPGGDISSSYQLQTETKKYFLKVNTNPFALAMFHAEQKGLDAIEKTQTITVPRVHVVGSLEGKSFLLMDFVEAKRPDANDFRQFGTCIGVLKKTLVFCRITLSEACRKATAFIPTGQNFTGTNVFPRN